MDDGAADYVLGWAEPAIQRLAALSRVYAGVTGDWLDAIGLERGMAVADLGCGPGDVTLAVADRVGPEGSVVGVDGDARPLAVARRRAAEAGVGWVRFEQADLTAWRPDRPVDAVVGRLILLHLADPTGLLARLARVVRPGGLLAFQDVVLATRAADPPLPLLTAFNGWLLETFRRAGRPTDMGLRLAAVFQAAGLPAPALTAGAPVERGPDAHGWSIVAGDVAALLPRFEQLGVVSPAEVGPESFERRLRAEAATHDAVLVNPLVVGAWARTPARAAVPRPRRGQG